MPYLLQHILKLFAWDNRTCIAKLTIFAVDCDWFWSKANSVLVWCVVRERFRFTNVWRHVTDVRMLCVISASSSSAKTARDWRRWRERAQALRLSLHPRLCLKLWVYIVITLSYKEIKSLLVKRIVSFKQIPIIGLFLYMYGFKFFL